MMTLLSIAALAYITIIMRARYELGGIRPNQQVLGKAALDGQRAMEQYCTGVVATGQGIWMVGRREQTPSEYDDAIPKGTIKLETLLPEGSKAARSSSVSLVSRLGEDGLFHVLASIWGDACLISSPDKKSILVLTEANFPDSKKYPRQTAVFRTNDQGKTWTFLQNGFLADVNAFATSLMPLYFYGDKEIWAWGGEQLFYTSDQGENVEAIRSLKGLWETSGGGSKYTTAPHVIQFNEQQARVWVSHMYWDGSNWQAFTRDVPLTRNNGHWEAGKIREKSGLFIYMLKENGSGRIIAEVSRSPDYSEHELAELTDDQSSWATRCVLPNAFWPFNASTYINSNLDNNFFVSGDIILISTTSNHTTFSIFSGKTTLHANAIFLSKDNGDSWTKLKIPSYLGILGFNPQTRQMYWNQGNWFESNDSNIYSDDLSR